MGNMVGLISVNNSKEDDECHLLKTNLGIEYFLRPLATTPAAK